jgi:lysozyme
MAGSEVLMQLIDQIKRDEGLRLSPYKDSLGKLTIGYGRCLDTRGISKDEAEYMLANDLHSVRIELAARIPWITDLNEARQAVLQNMAFNMGIPGLLGFRTTLALVKGGQFVEAAKAMLESKWAKQVGTRATRLTQQMSDGNWT